MVIFYVIFSLDEEVTSMDKPFIITHSARLIDTSSWPFKEFKDGVWKEVSSPLYGWELDPRDDDFESFKDESTAINAFNSWLSNK